MKRPTPRQLRLRRTRALAKLTEAVELAVNYIRLLDDPKRYIGIGPALEDAAADFKRATQSADEDEREAWARATGGGSQ